MHASNLPQQGTPDFPKPKLGLDRDLRVEHISPTSLTAFAGNSRKHPKKQISQIAASIAKFGFVSPILIADDLTIIAGHGRVLAALSLDMTTVPAIRVSHLSAAERRAYVIVDNRLAELATWDLEILAAELQGLSALDLDFDLEITGFEGAELDGLIDPLPAPDKADLAPKPSGPPVTVLGDVWLMGDHRLVCGDATKPAAYEVLMGEDRARMVFTDSPYNCPIDGNVGGLGRITPREFVMASGEMSDEEFQAFLHGAMACAAAVSVDGAIHFQCMDWRGLSLLQAAAKSVYAEYKNLIVWVKSNGGMGTFYRSRHELIAVFKVGKAAHTNTFGLGEGGRYRTNVWEYPGVNSFGAGRDEALEAHPTCKPVAMVADAIRDVSKRGEIVLDPFGGSGTTLIAAQKTRRRARLLELDPLYCDVICRRWTAYSRQPAIHAATGETFPAELSVDGSAHG